MFDIGPGSIEDPLKVNVIFVCVFCKIIGVVSERKKGSYLHICNVKKFLRILILSFIASVM